MRYQIFIPQIHCSGCVNLIKLTLEEKFPAVSVDENSKVAVFESDEDESNVKMKLDKLFETDLSTAGYEYSNLTVNNS
jgi:hypothetical protein